MDMANDNRAKIIVVDDERLSLASAKKCLADNYKVFTSSSGENLFKLLSKITPSLILLDVEMPGEDGYSVIKKLKADEKTSDIPVIFLTGKSSPEDEIKGLELGAADYVMKPFSEELLNRRIKMHLDIQTQKEELYEAIRAANVANEAKTTFIATMSHEMRTPLNAILGFTELTLDEYGLSDKVTSNLSKVEQAGQTLLNIVSDILDISKIETGMFELYPVEYEVPPRINDMVNQCIVYKGDKDIEFELIIGDDFPTHMFGDDLRVKQIFVNLLSNAFKYTPAGTVTFSLECERKGDECHIIASVSDTGPGMRPEALAHIFEDYYQADAQANRKIAGTGLGLSIARRLARMMGGDITVQSEIGLGSTFTITLIQEFVSDGAIDKKTVELLKNHTYVSELRHKWNNPLRMSLPYANVLIVDDVETNLEIARGMLIRYDIMATCVTSGPAAIEAIRGDIETGNDRFSAVFMDHMMPEMDGIEATKIIRELGSNYAKNIPIIAFTANAIVGSREMFLEEGFQDFISKPIESTRLDQIIIKWIYDEKREHLCKLCKDDKNKEPMCKRECIKNKRLASQSAAAYESTSSTSMFADFIITDIDYQRGVERFAGDEQAYISVLRTFSKNTPMVLENTRSLDEKDPSAYITAVHGLKGACYGICADEVGDLGKALEFAGADGDFDFISKNNDAFVVRMSSLISELDDFIDSLTDDSKKELKEAPDTGMLKTVLEACKNHSMFDTDDAVAELEKFEYSSNGDLVPWLREMADKMEYSEIIKRLEDMLK
ncbi:MAG: response regulator [Oscillospiraceae bacterium]|nr:response regulator [Oscillospiraceae bacterium]